MLLKCQSRARAKGLECSLTLDDVKRLTEPMVCSVTRLPLSWTSEHAENPFAPSLDRLDNSVGYTLANVRLVCWAYNKARSIWPDEVFDRLARSYVENRG